MCGRYQKPKVDKAKLAAEFGVSEDELPEFGEDEAAPGSLQEVVRAATGAREFAPMRWGFGMTVQGQKRLVFNTQAERVMTSEMWRTHFANRCIVPAAGFLEWPGKVKTAVTLRGQDVIGFAGLWGMWENPRTRLQEPTFSIFTTEPNAVMRKIHHRQPVILDRGDYEEWLAPAERPPVHLLRAFAGEATMVTPLEPTSGLLFE